MEHNTKDKILEAYQKFDKYTKIQLEVLYAFLYSKGWQSLGKKGRFMVFKAPKELEFNNDGKFNMPSSELQDIFDYGYFMKGVIQNLAQIYDLKEDTLLNILTKTPKELKEETENATLVLAFLKISA